MPASAALGGAVGLIVVASVAGCVGVGAIFANPNPDGCRNIEAVFVAALRATHVEKIAHGVSPFVVLGCRGLHRKRPRLGGAASLPVNIRSATEMSSRF